MKLWRWKVPAGHPGQSPGSWWAEQTAILILLRVAIRAARRGDRLTRDRVLATCQTGAAYEAAATDWSNP